MGLRDFDWSQLPEIPVDTQVQHGPEELHDGYSREEFEKLYGARVDDWQWELIVQTGIGNSGERPTEVPVTLGDKVIGRVNEIRNDFYGTNIHFTINDEWIDFVRGDGLSGISVGVKDEGDLAVDALLGPDQFDRKWVGQCWSHICPSLHWRDRALHSWIRACHDCGVERPPA